VKVPRVKHLSVNTMSLIQKQVKKVKEIRRFSKPNSVFAKWTEESSLLLDKAFEADRALSKIYKFIKDPEELEQTFAVLRKHFQQIKNQFLVQIATIKAYPTAAWLDFVDSCHHWKIIDKNLSSQDIDRVFIATNFEEEDLEENDDSSLCRYEYMEIITRMAKVKYQESGLAKTVHESCERLLAQFIVPNTIEHMEWQEFRDQQLWTLEVDDLLKANLPAIDALFKKFATNGTAKAKTLHKDDVIRMWAAAFHQRPRDFGQPSLTTQVLANKDKLAVVAYSLSKMTIQDEMRDFDNYNRMLPVEFYEFLGRFAHLVFTESLPLTKKLEKLLRLLLPAAGNYSFVPAPGDDEIDSDSDYDEDIADEVAQQILSTTIQR